MLWGFPQKPAIAGTDFENLALEFFSVLVFSGRISEI
jgi:hypothetical protein